MPKIFTLQQINEFRDVIRNHHGKMSNDELAAQLGIGATKVVELIREMKLNNRKTRKIVIKHGKNFNVHVHKSWLTGVE